ncbi:MAG TPA: MarR family transcriptional regulator [Burkholderiaceae bacterium]|nr:MarR family transcriptional regulator [Burkholderiaceae bacterium]
MIDLQAFLPYRLAVLSEAVSRCVSQVYGERFQLSRDEWRVLAALADAGTMKSSAAALHTTLDKMQVSRACGRLERRGLIRRDEDPEDRRNKILRLSAQGRELLDQLVPVVQARAAELLQALDPQESRALERIIEKLLAQARHVSKAG